jgi:YesN/AraC family two-component response regulator
MTTAILIVEDDRVTNETVRLMVAKKFPDADVYAAENGTQGVEVCREQLPDIVITDVNMPGMDGNQMAEAIKALKGDTKFIVLTGYSDKIHLAKFSGVDLVAYILKPIDFKKLFVAIDTCIDEIAQQRLHPERVKAGVIPDRTADQEGRES